MQQPLEVAVLGAGLMGHGIAQVMAAAGHRVALTDTDPVVLASAPHRVARNLDEMQRASAPVLQRMRLVDTIADAVGGADLVIESIPEDIVLKQAILAEAAALAAPQAVLTSNTSVIPITLLGARLDDEARGRLIGTHFWNPPHLIPLVEVVRTAWTRADVVQRMVLLLREAGKMPVVVHRDVTGFIGNRLNQAMWREALSLIEAGVCDAETIDIVVKNSFGLRLPVLGPMENADLIGLELTRTMHALLFPELSSTAFPSPLLDAAIARGETGMHAGAGLRRWTPEEVEATRARLAAHLCHHARDTAT